MLSASSGEKNDPSTVQATVSKGKSTVAGTTILSQSEQAVLKFITNQSELVVLRLLPVKPNPNQKGGGKKSVRRNYCRSSNTENDSG
jgi:hypothetical protein